MCVTLARTRLCNFRHENWGSGGFCSPIEGNFLFVTVLREQARSIAIQLYKDNQAVGEVKMTTSLETDLGKKVTQAVLKDIVGQEVQGKLVTYDEKLYKYGHSLIE